MRVRWPLPRALNHSTTSLSRRRWTEVLPLGMTTRADFQKSAPRDSPRGALRRVLSAPRSRRASTSLREYLAIVDFFFIFARSLGADDADKVFGTPRVDDTVHLNIDAAQCDPADFAVVFAIVDSLQSLVLKDGRRGQERDAVPFQVASGLCLVPLELEFLLGHRVPSHVNTIVYTNQRMPAPSRRDSDFHL